MGMEQFNVEWFDHGREPQCQADPAYPCGIDVVVPDRRAGNSCTVELPYPARRCGFYNVTCTVCGMKVLVTTAGRADDPRSVTLPCERAAVA
jgi:hypothetical protein